MMLLDKHFDSFETLVMGARSLKYWSKYEHDK
jgi:hypothetical protein